MPNKKTSASNDEVFTNYINDRTTRMIVTKTARSATPTAAITKRPTVFMSALSGIEISSALELPIAADGLSLQHLSVLLKPC